MEVAPPVGCSSRGLSGHLRRHNTFPGAQAQVAQCGRQMSRTKAKASKMPPTISHVAQCTASCTRLSRECLQHLQPGSQFPWLLTNIALCVTFLKGLCQSTGDRNLLLYLLPTSCGRSPMRLAHAFRHDGSTRRGSPMALVRLRTLVQRFLH